jgi:hypothetical protein
VNEKQWEITFPRWIEFDTLEEVNDWTREHRYEYAQIKGLRELPVKGYVLEVLYFLDRKYNTKLDKEPEPLKLEDIIMSHLLKTEIGRVTKWSTIRRKAEAKYGSKITTIEAKGHTKKLLKGNDQFKVRVKDGVERLY